MLPEYGLDKSVGGEMSRRRGGGKYLRCQVGGGSAIKAAANQATISNEHINQHADYLSNQFATVLHTFFEQLIARRDNYEHKLLIGGPWGIEGGTRGGHLQGEGSSLAPLSRAK
ncbi:hypothetical protein CEXT_74221 [Caerostris extrusa]|uniref:Uncharacterized protein n=1 Tax=Caerostris extrusa TaxID=172846 RepID=A0AAV4UX57_CAEEX|nr:hypothetical protein CEXT_74221 [Caerostris extrusa]